MTDDGELDAKSYSRDQLVRALHRIDREKYPLNFAILTRELASRPNSTSSPSPAPIPHKSGGRFATEYVVLVSLAGSMVFFLYLMLFGSFTNVYGPPLLAAVPGAAFAIAGVSSFWLILRRSAWGAALAIVFYGVQVLSFPILDSKFEFSSLPTIQFRLNGDPAAPVQVNLVALVLFLLSLALAADFRRRMDETSAQHNEPSGT